MERFLVFYGPYYYPGGGMEDFLRDEETLEEAMKAVDDARLAGYSAMENKEVYIERAIENNWAHVYDTKLREIVWEQNSY